MKSRNRAWVAFNVVCLILVVAGPLALAGNCGRYSGAAFDRCSADHDTTAITGLALLALPIGNLIFWARKNNPPKVPAAGPVGIRQCPFCKSSMPRDASVCATCTRESDAWSFHENRWWAKAPNDEWRWLDEQKQEWHTPEPPSVD